MVQVELDATELRQMINCLEKRVNDLYFDSTKSREAKANPDFAKRKWIDYQKALGTLEKLRGIKA